MSIPKFYQVKTAVFSALMISVFCCTTFSFSSDREEEQEEEKLPSSIGMSVYYDEKTEKFQGDIFKYAEALFERVGAYYAKKRTKAENKITEIEESLKDVSFLEEETKKGKEKVDSERDEDRILLKNEQKVYYAKKGELYKELSLFMTNGPKILQEIFKAVMKNPTCVASGIIFFEDREENIETREEILSFQGFLQKNEADIIAVVSRKINLLREYNRTNKNLSGKDMDNPDFFLRAMSKFSSKEELEEMNESTTITQLKKINARLENELRPLDEFSSLLGKTLQNFQGNVRYSKLFRRALEFTEAPEKCFKTKVRSRGTVRSKDK